MDMGIEFYFLLFFKR